MSTMRAVVIEATGGPEVLVTAQVAMPVRASAEFLIRIAAAGVNPIDMKTRAGGGTAAAI